MGINISHEERQSTFESAKEALVDKIQKRGDLPYVSVEKQLELLRALTECELGRFLIQTGGLNGYWIHYIVTHPASGRTPVNSLESFLLNQAPSGLATQQRFSIFKKQIQKRIYEGCSLASIPSGLMADLLDLDYSDLQTFSLHGIDLDPETHSQAMGYAGEKGLLSHCRFFEKDAWVLGLSEKFDLVASNGLTIYEPSDERVVDLYRQFYNALKSKGTLVTSFWTQPPVPGTQTGWKLDRVNQEDAFLQKILLVDIIEAKWQVYRTEETVKAQLMEAGFREIEIFYDDAHIFPTVVAEKLIESS